MRVACNDRRCAFWRRIAASLAGPAQCAKLGGDQGRFGRIQLQIAKDLGDQVRHRRRAETYRRAWGRYGIDHCLQFGRVCDALSAVQACVRAVR